MMKPRVAKIAVEQAAYHFDRLYDYAVPDTLGAIPRGSRVMVPFGGGNRKRQGVVVGYEESSDFSRLKPVFSVLDPEPLLNDELMDLALWLKERTFCTVFDAVRAMLPTGLYMRVKPVYKAAEGAGGAEALLPDERAMLACLSRYPDGLDRDRLLAKLGLSGDSDLPERLVRRGVLERSDDAFRRLGDAAVRMVRLTPGGEAGAAVRLTDKQKSVLSLLEGVGCASVKEIGYYCSVTPAVTAALEKKGLVESYEAEVLRTPRESVGKPELLPAVLNPEQQRAFDELLAMAQSGRPGASLLYGVTGSGKTQVYMNLIDRVVAAGRQVIVMVPEISLTPQMMALFLKRYGDRVAVLHSGLAIGERMDEWKRVRRGEASIVLGTRSAVFAPVANLGLLVMDEEQEHTYKSESSPRFHARDVAKFRCGRHNALLLLTSATPSVESFHAARSGRYALQALASRYGDTALPAVEVVDMREQPEGSGIVSPRLRDAMKQTLEEGRQVILLLNRRGYHTFVSCRSCGHVVTCPSCSISLTYHRANGRLMCHYCGHSQEPVRVCPACGSDKIRYSGLGTQRAEQELETLFPDTPILRMDTDAAMSRFAYEKKFRQFSEGAYSILIGTQMVAKGLDFPNVGLVGVLSADQSLYGDDYRSFETTFALLTQVVGRAGRRDVRGRALIQTYTPENYVIALAAKQDYEGFYALEIESRRMMKYPPYTDLCLFGFVGTAEETVRQAAFRFLERLREAATERYRELPVIVLDPTPASVGKVAGKFRYKLLMKTRGNALMRRMVGELLTGFGREPENKNVSVFADINPAGIL